MTSSPIAVVGAHGVVGRRVMDELARVGATHRAVERGALEAGLADASVVINAAPTATAARVLEAAAAAGVHYVDLGGDQRTLRMLYEEHDATARKAGIVALPGAGLDCALGDLAAAAAARGAELADAAPESLDIAICYVFSELALSATSQRALFHAATARPLIWRRDRWEPGPLGDAVRVNAGELGERTAVAYGAGDPLTIPRHVPARRVASYVAATRSRVAAAALRWMSAALPVVAEAATRVLEPFPPSEAELERTRFAVIATVEYGFVRRRVEVRGRDIYRTTAAIAAWCACRLAEDRPPRVGMCAPAELFDPERALAALADRAGLTVVLM